MQATQWIKRALVPSRLGPASRTVRFRLTLLYGALFLAGGAGLLAITYLLVAHFTGPRVLIDMGNQAARTGGGAPHVYRGSGPIPGGATKALTPSQVHQFQQLRAQASVQRAADLHQLLVGSGIGLAVMAVLAVAAGWVVAGRVLRPLRTMTTATQQISARNLHERLALPGPKDELRVLADTIDGLLGRLQGAFDSQRRFVANAAHELRTPLTLERALLEVALANPRASVASLRKACKQAIAASEKHEHLIESLLTLATSERGPAQTEPIDLSVIVDTVLLCPHLDIQSQRLQVTTTIRPAPAVGDARLVERLAANLVDNAIRYNRQDGLIQIATGITAGRAFLSVSNSGPVIPSDQIDRLLQPFQRLGTARAAPDGSVGLGMSIVSAIAAAHGAHFTARPRTGGGLDAEVVFPLPVQETNGHARQHRRNGSGSDRVVVPSGQPDELGVH
jgi:signal transduction histidine kinase